MTDIKRALAYSTVSHLGLMMLSLGAFGLAAGDVSSGRARRVQGDAVPRRGQRDAWMHEETDMRRMGGLRRAMPLTALTFVIGAASLAGIAPLSGFFSKDEVLVAVLEHRNPAFIALALAGVLLSALYMAAYGLADILRQPAQRGSGTRPRIARADDRAAAVACRSRRYAGRGGSGLGQFVSRLRVLADDGA